MSPDTLAGSMSGASRVWSNFLSYTLPTKRSVDQTSDCFLLQINDVVKIQAFIRANKARDDYKTLSK